MYGRGNKTRSSYLGITLHGSGNEEKTNSYPVIGIALGVALGTAFGVVLDKLALGIGFGIALGAAIALALSSRQSGKTGEPDETPGATGIATATRPDNSSKPAPLRGSAKFRD
jgi:hypothetical protein